MFFKVIRPINRNEEITTFYGENYFEWGNAECMCATCELRGRGAFSDPSAQIAPAPIEGSEGHRAQVGRSIIIDNGHAQRCQWPPSIAAVSSTSRRIVGSTISLTNTVTYTVIDHCAG